MAWCPSVLVLGEGVGRGGPLVVVGWGGCADGVGDPCGRVELRLLGEVADGEAGGEASLAAVPVVEAGHDLEQAALARAVAAQHADLGARVERQRDVLQHRAIRWVEASQLVTGVDEFVSHDEVAG